MRSKRPLTLLFFGLVLFDANSARSDVALPYTARTHSYSGWSTAATGDIRSVGMGGATAGLGDTELAATLNPAGLAMALDNADLNYSSNDIRDGNLQSLDTPISLATFGIAMSQYPWGFGIAYGSTYREENTYLIPAMPTVTDKLTIQLKELRLSVARLLIQSRLSLGASLNLALAEESIGASSNYSAGINVTLGAMYQLEDRVLLGVSYQPGMRLAPGSNLYNRNTSSVASPIQGYYQPLQIPNQWIFGVGWIPNRFIRGDFTLGVIGTTQETALLRDDNVLVGEHRTLQPKLGVAYVFADFKNTQATFFSGTYLECTRIEGEFNRMHATLGVEVKFWMVTAGYGVDQAIQYQNHLVSIGLDLFEIMEKGNLIPKSWHSDFRGWWPNPMGLSDEGLARPIVKNWRPQGPDMNPVQVGLDLPDKIKKEYKVLTEPTSDKMP